ncbi:MAG: Rod shape-determining protein [Candidatus Magasanikbacteria bacterium GW2011_GWA2_45_39]|uniref:Rod shape-determining protein n=2 Tax=Candidatus Magasanikiibacteriota TaxID=1752731 RepID=A0A0G1N091_9BACT|nr:MAG: Rod shape-determining protein [Candidatus Magasanikbacteria bacterium GW2011_GWA2_45_39]KKU13919.1 MAG: Rod shape-determining protein [Candidatus Magasanikbacteria bacterium GW2011_GWC2_45_8]HBW74353.1 rod shape-determining protein RodA [Candidatus Magasanikbacteria bacterium]
MPYSFITRRLSGFDWYLAAAVFLLGVFGLAALYSIGFARPETNFLDFKKQLVFFGVGLVCMAALGSANYMMVRNSGKMVYGVSLILLVVVLFFGHVINGTKGWFVVAGISFQPVELVKVALIVFFALFAGKHARSYETRDFFLGSLIIVLAPVALVMLQPDMGSALLLLGLWFLLMLVLGARTRYVIALVCGAALIIAVSWLFLLKNYQKDRILIFFDPSRDPLGRGYNVSQSVIAVGAGGLMGRGLGYGSQSQLRFLPEMQTDFIFAMIGEEFGFVGTGLIIILSGIVLARLFFLALSARDDFAFCVIAGTLILFAEQFVVNMGMNMGLLPVTGIPLPFVSAGGSSMIMNFLLIGTVESLVRSRRAEVTMGSL